MADHVIGSTQPSRIGERLYANDMEIMPCEESSEASSIGSDFEDDTDENDKAEPQPVPTLIATNNSRMAPSYQYEYNGVVIYDASARIVQYPTFYNP